jgi:cilia- and flagella-associated protein 57
MASSSLVHRHVFGLAPTFRGNLVYLDEQTLVYPAGSSVILCNIGGKMQTFLPGTENAEGITCFAMSPNHRFIAVAERGEKAVITVWDTQNYKRRRMITVPDVMSKEFVAIAFSSDNRHLVAVSGGPDWALVYLAWDKSKVVGVAKAVCSSSTPVTSVSFHPSDLSTVCLCGNQFFKFFRHTDQQVKQVSGGMGKRDPQVRPHSCLRCRPSAPPYSLN